MPTERRRRIHSGAEAEWGGGRTNDVSWSAGGASMSASSQGSDLIYDWNTAGEAAPPRPRPIEFDDETLRDGCQSPSVRDPDIGTKIRLLHLMEQLGIHTLDVGLPGAGARARA